MKSDKDSTRNNRSLDSKDLFKDLKSRLFYVKCNIPGFSAPLVLREIRMGDQELLENTICNFGRNSLDYELDYYLREVKPYLRTFLDLTKKEINELESIGWKVDKSRNNELLALTGDLESAKNLIDYLTDHMIDFRHLIDRGLAERALEGMYKFD